MTIVEFLRARYDEDEAAARRAGADNPVWLYDGERFEVAALGGWSIATRRASGPLCDVDGEHIARHDPARVLREVEAKRRLLDVIFGYEAALESEWGCGHGSEAIAAGQCPSSRLGELEALRLLALPFADHPDYDPTWSPA